MTQDKEKTMKAGWILKSRHCRFLYPEELFILLSKPSIDIFVLQRLQFYLIDFRSMNFLKKSTQFIKLMQFTQHCSKSSIIVEYLLRIN